MSKDIEAHIIWTTRLNSGDDLASGYHFGSAKRAVYLTF